MPKKKIAQLLKNMIHVHAPDNYGVFNFINTPLDIFTAVISMVSYHSRMESIKRAVSRIQREPKESLEIPLKKYLSLLLTASSLDYPNMSNSEAIQKAHKQCIRAVDFLIENHTKVQLDRMKQEQYTRMNQKSNLKDVISFVANLESDPRYQLQSIKSLVNQPVNFSLYHTDTLATITNQQHQHQDSYDEDPHRDHPRHPHHPPHIQQHGGSHQHFYGGHHLHGVGSFKPWSTSQGRHEYLPQRPHQSSRPSQVDHQQDHSFHQHQQDSGHQGHGDNHHQNVPDSHQVRDVAHYEDGRETPPSLRDETEYAGQIPDIYYQSRDGRFTKLERRKLWIKDSMGGMYCLDEQYTYDRKIRSPSPDVDDKQDKANAETSTETEKRSKDREH